MRQPLCWAHAVITAALVSLPSVARAQSSSSIDALIFPRDGRIVDYSSYDRKFNNDDFVPVAPGQTVTLVDHRGAGIVRRWWLTIAPLNNREIQRQLIVRCYWDDESAPSVEVPGSDFFGVGFGEWKQYISAPLNMTSGGYNSYWAMPFKRHARITVENRAAIAVERLYYNIAVEAHDRLPDSLLYFHAQFRRTTTVRGQPVTLLEATGRGHYVGTVLSMQPLHSRHLWFLEGNERVFVDGEQTPSILGTGTEDYFSSGWYFDTGPYSAPYHGLTIKDTETGRISAYRWHIEDPITFTRSLRFTIEHGGTNDAPDTDYSSVAFWYQTHPHAPFPALPPRLMPAEVWKPPVVSGLIEAEDLLPKATVTAGELRVQEMTEWETDSAAWGGAKQLWWVEAPPGATLHLPLTTSVAGTPELVGYFTRAQDYGQIRVSVNDKPLSPIVNGYSPDVRPTGPISFGRVALQAGTNDLTIEIVGKDPRAQGYSNGYLVGIDGFLLRQ
ncbi:MAG TPA: glycoside hydrolase family 172 protein [Gemmatimonadaceae bacterium]|nr:glycoside hydrolase family 172 protein [Gemmatimonadaceae bacterium]